MFGRKPKQRDPRPSELPAPSHDPDEADAALQDAQGSLEVARSHVTRADHLVSEAREIRKRNHFAERLLLAYRGQGALGQMYPKNGGPA